MNKAIARGTIVAATMAFGTVVFAQSTGQTQQPPTTPPAQSSAAPQKAPSEQITVTGCVQKEADYRAAHNLGKGGAAGTGVGAGDEYVLVSVATGDATVGTSGTPTTPPGAPAAYELTGEKENEVGAFVGKRVEISGKLKAAEMGATGPTGGATAGTPPAGTDVVSKDLKLREIEVASVREVPGACPAGK